MFRQTWNSLDGSLKIQKGNEYMKAIFHNAPVTKLYSIQGAYGKFLLIKPDIYAVYNNAI